VFFSQVDTKRAVAYYRHSAEDKQENSVEIQRDKITAFADEHNIELIHEEADEGKSGLQASRPGFQSIMQNWVQNPDAPDFDYILVLDVSRWGRFQDQDESAHYEFVCKQHGKQVIYVTRGMPFKDGKLIGHLQTSIERYMAAEYSKQLSEKVFAGSVKVSEQGYSAGGSACYGMVRVRISADKKIREVLRPGEWKVLANDRITFAPANDETTEAVKYIFDSFVTGNLESEQIAAFLNSKQIPSANGGTWDARKVLYILQNETYTGKRIYNRTWSRLKQKSRKNKREDWVIVPNAFEAIVSEDVFQSAKQRIKEMRVKRIAKPASVIRNIRQAFKQELELELRRSGYQDHLIEYILYAIPVIYAVSSGTDMKYWFLKLEEQHYPYEEILAVLVDYETYNSKTLLVNQSQFNALDQLIITDQDDIIEQTVDRDSLISFIAEKYELECTEENEA